MGSFYSAAKGAYLGVLTAFPVGVYMVGEYSGGNGNFWVTTAVPWAFTVGISVTYAAVGVIDSPAFYLSGGAIALLSSIALYEISSEIASPDDESSEVKVSLYGDYSGAGVALLGKL
jgi:hypothetical protein